MSIVEIRCPRCGSICYQKDAKTQEYYCDHCSATFRFVDTTQRKVITDIRAHNCPICGRPVGTGEGYRCMECGQQYLCSNCVDPIKEHKTRLEKIICKLCLQKKGLMCVECSNKYEHYCVACGKLYCNKHTESHMHIRVRKGNFALYHSMWCGRCKGYVCNGCYVKKTGFFSGTTYHCKRCGTKLKVYNALTERHRQWNRNVQTQLKTR